MTTEETRDKIIGNIKWLPSDRNKAGGQTVGNWPIEQTLYSEDLDIKITVGSERSMYKNKELAIKMFILALDNILK